MNYLEQHIPLGFLGYIDALYKWLNPGMRSGVCGCVHAGSALRYVVLCLPHL